MSLLRALRAYIGLGPDEDYEELYRRPGSVKPAGDQRLKEPRGTANGQRRRGGYLDDLKRPADEPELEVVDIRTARIDARRADGTRQRQPVGASARRSGRLSETDQLLDELTVGAEEIDVRPETPEPEASVDEGVSEVGRGSTGLENGSPDQSEDQAQDLKADPVSTQDEKKGATVRSIDSIRRRPKTLTPESFADAKSVADDFKFGTPVVVNLQDVDRELARRLVDFASGVCYSLDGSMEKLAPQVFLLTPDGHEVSDDDRRRIEERGYAR